MCAELCVTCSNPIRFHNKALQRLYTGSFYCGRSPDEGLSADQNPGSDQRPPAAETGTTVDTEPQTQKDYEATPTLRWFRVWAEPPGCSSSWEDQVQKGLEKP